MVFDLINKLLKRKKEPKYSIKMTPQMWEELPKITRKQIAELHARLKLAEEERDELKKEVKKLRGKLKPPELKLLEEALRKKKEIEKKLEQRRFRLILEKPVKVKSHDKKYFTGKFGVYKYLYAFELEEAPSGLGYTTNLILKKSPDAKNTSRKTTTLSLSELLEIPYVISNLKTGHYEAPIYSDGTPVFSPQNTMFNGGGSESDDSKKAKKSAQKASVSVKQIDLVKQVEALMKEVSKLKHENEILQSKKYKAEKRVEELMSINEDLANKLALAAYRADLNQAISQSQISQVRGMMKDYALILSSAMSSEIDRRLTQKINMQLAKGLKEVRNQLEKAYGTSVADEVWDIIESRFRSMFTQMISLITKLQPLVKETGTKAHEEGGK